MPDGFCIALNITDLKISGYDVLHRARTSFYIQELYSERF